MLGSDIDLWPFLGLTRPICILLKLQECWVQKPFHSTSQIIFESRHDYYHFLYFNMGSLENKVWSKNVQANVSLGMQCQEL